MLITYVRKPNDQIDEQVQMSNSLKERDIATCNIILDFEKKFINQKNTNDLLEFT